MFGTQALINSRTQFRILGANISLFRVSVPSFLVLSNGPLQAKFPNTSKLPFCPDKLKSKVASSMWTPQARSVSSTPASEIKFTYERVVITYSTMKSGKPKLSARTMSRATHSNPRSSW